ncbi:helix-turn-helix transcriptional regulator [Hymenobacter sp.]|uniref:helix-turn-helix domain-containing protein n=1 Tax=Hymenobacter sp. TaxID=1898978 RepID=UPI00286C782A|nr:helix-turn-helix transcriptional regulator [Hymenobacter sp.]
MQSRPLEASYTELVAVVSPAAGSPPPNPLPEVGHFNVFLVEDLMRGYQHRPPMAFDRRAFYKISLVRGRSRVEYADQAIDVEQQALWFATSRVPYRWLPHDPAQVGYFCIFTDEFLLPTNGGMMLNQLPIFQPGGCPVWEIAPADYAAVEVIFEKMTREIASDFAYKYDLLRAYLLELIYLGQKLQPTPARAPAPSAAARLVALFMDLLERQFPLATPQQQLRLRTATDYANRLAVHVNHLNRVLKDTTGQTTTALIGGRVAQEAKLLLKQTNWTVSEIADGLGFADVAHFCHFFKRQTNLVPSAFRGPAAV